MEITRTLTPQSHLSQIRDNPPSKMFVVPSVMTAWVPCVCLLPNMKQPVNRGLIMLPSRFIVFIVLHWSLDWKIKTHEQSNKVLSGIFKNKQEHNNFYMYNQWGVSFPPSTLKALNNCLTHQWLAASLSSKCQSRPASWAPSITCQLPPDCELNEPATVTGSLPRCRDPFPAR